MSFTQQLKKLAKESVIYGVGGALSRFVSVITAPILTHTFAPSEYGVIGLLQTAVMLFIMVAGMNLNSGTFFYFYKYNAQKNKQVVLSTAFLFYLLIAFLFSLFLWFYAPYVEALLRMSAGDGHVTTDYDYAKYLQILSIGMFFSLLDTNFRSLLRMTNQPYKFIALSVLQVVTNLLAIIILVLLLKQGIEGAMWSFTISSMVTAFVGYLMVFRNYRALFSCSVMLMILAYALPAFPAVVLNWGLMQTNRFFINYYSTLEQQGFYSIAFQIAMVAMMVTTAFRTAYDPFAFSIMKRDDAPQTYARMYTVFVVGFAVFASCFCLYGNLFIWLFAPENYYEAYFLIFILVFSFLFQGANNILGTGLWITKNMKYTSYCQIIAFTVNVALNFLLIPKFMALGAAIAFFGGTLVQSLSYYFFAQRFYFIPYRYWQLLFFVFVLFGIVFTFTLLTTGFSLWMSCLIATFLLPILVALGWQMGLTQEERNWAGRYVKKALLRLC